MQKVEDLSSNLHQNALGDLARAIIKRNVNGANLSLQVSPCSWMYPNYGLQVEIVIEGGGKAYLIDKTVMFASASEADLNRLFDKVEIVPCKHCGKPAFDPSSIDTNRQGSCEACFLKELQKEFDKETAKAQKKLAALDAKRRAEGFTHRVEAWIHPEQGEDRQLSIWFKGNPTPESIKKELVKAHSVVFDDYSIVKL